MSKLQALRSLAIFGALSGFTDLDGPKVHRDIKAPKKPKTEAEIARLRGLHQWEYNGVIVYTATKKKAIKLVEQKLSK